jgi:hypothetical protein
MEKNPFTFSETNKRMVINNERSSAVYYGAAVIFAASLSFYHKRFFRIDGNVLNMAAFAVASVPASLSLANFALGSVEIEAGLINNLQESKH